MTVTRALDAAGFTHRGRGPFLEVQVPPEHRLRFEHRSRVELSFNASVWIPDEAVELVVPGCAFLDVLEDILRLQGATRSVWIGGELAANEALEDAWFRDFQVGNAKLTAKHGRFGRDTYLRFLYEVRLPGPPPRTELVPVVWNVGRRALLTPRQAAELLSRRWYGEAELAGLVNDATRPVSPASHQQARERCDEALAHRLAPLLEASRGSLSERVRKERTQLDADLSARLEDASSEDERHQIEDEYGRRVSLLEQQLQEAYRAKVGAETQLVQLEHSPIFTYTHTGSGRSVDVAPSIVGRRIIDAQCARCDEPKRRYLLAPRVKASPPLICEDCGRACADSACDVVLKRGGRPHCTHCTEARWCSAHQVACAICACAVCPDHRDDVDCCGRPVCARHTGKTVDGAHVLCAEHGKQCAVDGHWYALGEGVTCPVTGLWLACSNALVLPGDPRPLHPDAVVTCASSGVRLAQDRARRCDVDRAWHHPAEIVTAQRGRVALCPAHRVKTGFPPVEVIDARESATCEETQRVAHRDDLRVCSATGRRVHQSLLVTCPVTGKQLLVRGAVTLADDPRTMHPTAIVRCAVSGKPVAGDRAVADEVLVGRVLHPMEATTCALSGLVGSRRSRVTLQCCGRQAIREPSVPAIAGRFLNAPIGEGWVCTTHFGECSSFNHVVELSRLVKSATTGALLCPDHRKRCDCHGNPHEPERLWATPYLDHVMCTEQVRQRCGRCGLDVLAFAKGQCEWCDRSSSLDQSPEDARAAYTAHVAPRLPWFVISPAVDVSGNTRMWLFDIGTFFQGRRQFLVSPKGVWERRSRTHDWKEA